MKVPDVINQKELRRTLYSIGFLISVLYTPSEYGSVHAIKLNVYGPALKDILASLRRKQNNVKITYDDLLPNRVL